MVHLDQNILLSYTSIKSGDYFFGSQTSYDYYSSGKLYSEKEYNLADPEKEDETTRLTSAKYYYEDGRDSSQNRVHLYSTPEKKSSYIYEYEYHPNGKIASKSEKTSFGKVTDYESYDDRGNLTQSNSYNIYFEVYNIKKFIYNKKNQLIELSVNDFGYGGEYSFIYDYDNYGNKTHTYRKSDETTILIEEHVFEFH